MAWFKKRETVFCRQDKAGWLAARTALKEAGIQSIRARHYEVEPPVGGCGSKLDIRNFGPNGKIDREMYYIEVLPEEAEQARQVLADLEKAENEKT